MLKRVKSAGEFQHDEMAEHVGLHVGVWVDHGEAHAGLGSEMDDAANAAGAHRKGGHRLAVGYVGVLEAEAGVAC